MALSLRLRLVLSFLAVGSLILVVGVTSFFVNDGVQARLAGLRSGNDLDLRHVDLGRVGLEVEGHWTDAGFVASDIEVLPSRRHPKLRGAIEALDPNESTLTVFGLPIGLDEETRWPAGVQRSDLSLGQRVELTCEVEPATAERPAAWTATVIETEDVKDSDKIKGTATTADLDGVAPDFVTFHGLQVVLEPRPQPTHESPLDRIEMATRLTLALHETRAVAYELVSRDLRTEDVDPALEPGRLPEHGAERLLDARQGFLHHLDEARVRSALGGESSSRTTARWLDELADRQSDFDDRIRHFLQLTYSDQEAARVYLGAEFTPFLEGELQPLVSACLGKAEEDLGDQLRAIGVRTATTTRVAFVTSVVALLLAAGAGVLMWRSIHRPILALHEAAVQLGRGCLDTRVAVPTRDEIGELAEAFNRMAADLQATTVSIAEKELLLREVHHRVKNNMQVVSSLLAMQSSTSSEPEVLERFTHSQNRIRSMALIHEQLYRSNDLAEIDIRSYLELLTSHLAHSAGRSEDVDVELDVAPISLDIDQSLACGLIVNELVSNAFKHAFPGGRKGGIRVRLAARGASYVLSVSDDGRGADGRRDTSQTLGLSLVETLARQLRGRLEFEEARGFRVRVIFPAGSPARAELVTP